MGSYLAIKLEYNSCLFEESFNEALANYTKITELRKAQEMEIKAFEDEQNELEAEKLEAGEEFEREEKEWHEYTYAPFQT